MHTVNRPVHETGKYRSYKYIETYSIHNKGTLHNHAENVIKKTYIWDHHDPHPAEKEWETNTTSNYHSIDIYMYNSYSVNLHENVLFTQGDSPQLR